MNKQIKLLLSAILLASIQLTAYSLTDVAAVYSYKSGVPTQAQVLAAGALGGANAQELRNSLHGRDQLNQFYGIVGTRTPNLSVIATDLQNKSRAIVAATHAAIGAMQARAEEAATRKASPKKKAAKKKVHKVPSAQDIAQEQAILKNEAGQHVADLQQALTHDVAQDKQIPDKLDQLAAGAQEEAAHLEAAANAAINATVGASASVKAEVEKAAGSVKQEAANLKAAAGKLKGKKVTFQNEVAKTDAAAREVVSDLADFATGKSTSEQTAVNLENSASKAQVNSSTLDQLKQETETQVADVRQAQESAAQAASQAAETLNAEAKQVAPDAAKQLETASLKIDAGAKAATEHNKKSGHAILQLEEELSPKNSQLSSSLDNLVGKALAEATGKQEAGKKAAPLSAEEKKLALAKNAVKLAEEYDKKHGTNKAAAAQAAYEAKKAAVAIATYEAKYGSKSEEENLPESFAEKMAAINIKKAAEQQERMAQAQAEPQAGSSAQAQPSAEEAQKAKAEQGKATSKEDIQAQLKAKFKNVGSKILDLEEEE